MTTNDTSVVDSFTNTAEWTFTLAFDPDGTGWQIHRSNGAQARMVPERHAKGQNIADGRAVLDEWKRMFDGDLDLLGAPDDHVTIRAFLDGGGEAAAHPSTDWQLEPLAARLDPDRRGYHLANVRHVAYVCRVDPASMIVPLTDDTRTDEEKADEVRRSHSAALWTNELLTNPDLADRFEAGLNVDQRKFLDEERHHINEDNEVDRQPFAIDLVDLAEYRCGLTGETHHGPAVVVRARGGWVADAVRDAADRLVFSPAALRAALDGQEVAA